MKKKLCAYGLSLSEMPCFFLLLLLNVLGGLRGHTSSDSLLQQYLTQIKIKRINFR